MLEPKRADFRHPRLELFHLGFVLGDLDLTDLMEPAVVPDKRLDGMPDFHGGGGQRDLRWMTAETPYPARIHAGGEAARKPFFDHLDAQPTPAQMERRRTAVQPAADDDDICGARTHGVAMYRRGRPLAKTNSIDPPRQTG